MYAYNRSSRSLHRFFEYLPRVNYGAVEAPDEYRSPGQDAVFDIEKKGSRLYEYGKNHMTSYAIIMEKERSNMWTFYGRYRHLERSLIVLFYKHLGFRKFL